MLLLINGIKVFVKKNFRIVSPHKQTILFLHGFGGSSNDWKEIFSLFDSEYQLIAIDLPGFGKSSKPRSDKFYQSDFLVSLISKISLKLKLEKIILAGYSMGGRLALQFACKHPEKLKGVILESSSPGLKTKLERQLRIKNDEKLISFIKKNSLKDFFTFWQNQPLFASQENLPSKKQISILKSKVNSNSKIGLINSLEYFGQGEMESLWQRLSKIKIPMLLLSGEFDTKYASIQSEMSNLIPDSSHKIIECAGHNLHLEKPEVFVNLVREFLKILID
ncbi:MAG: 2-succinyl-6-hydroxy-2,4-cyclohexadiene-1-carboxylate synthase [Ignavibacteria bacterium]|nr:2-succinyl-6-hydroxy-2,4-cyclohexadiene-1-carboxylate synthase [Ignavibacteria bacterium]